MCCVSAKPEPYQQGTNDMKNIVLATAISALAVAASGGLVKAACPNGQQAYYTQDVDGLGNPIADEHCRKVYDHGHNGVAWTGDPSSHLSPVMVDADSDPSTPDTQLVIDGKPIVSGGYYNGDHQHNEPVVKGINGVAIGDGAQVGRWVPTDNNGTPEDASDDVPGHYEYYDNSTAIGANTSVQHDHSTAIGADAKSTRNHQVTLGTGGDTIRAPGIASEKSKERQSGPLEVVTTDASGNLASDGGYTFNELNAHSATLQSHSATLNAHSALLSQHTAKLEEHAKGLAIAMSLPDAWIEANKRFAIAGSIGGFGDETALGFAGILRLDDVWSVNGKLGADTDFSEFGWTVGARASW